LALEILTLLLERPSDDSVEVSNVIKLLFFVVDAVRK
jgi:hypothetical protein